MAKWVNKKRNKIVLISSHNSQQKLKLKVRLSDSLSDTSLFFVSFVWIVSVILRALLVFCIKSHKFFLLFCGLFCFYLFTVCFSHLNVYVFHLHILFWFAYTIYKSYLVFLIKIDILFLFFLFRSLKFDPRFQTYPLKSLV